ncbi:xanthine dehydrogenase family protein molybdopterin-binding subunit [Streptomyces sp. ODS28]|uniref:xanthine dehydrogenase family protein molybdopterin-binding subunit n=1 Tax=Streptomyces sp. ODS28 TaxID=3136688 RepID=UPI0031F0AC09
MTETPPAGYRRPDGPEKLTGTARYAGDTTAAGLDPADHAALVTAAVPHARIASLDIEAALAAPGVTAVLTAADLPPMALETPFPLGQPLLPMHGGLAARVRYEGQPLAIVLAATGEQARYAARLVRAEYDRTEQVRAFEGAEDAVPRVNITPPEEERGDLGAGLAAAHTTVRETYETADRHHNPIEPSATHARWEGDRLTLHDSVQSITGTRDALAAVFGVRPEDVRVICPFTGGGFGCKGFVWPHQVLAAAAARAVGRPVKLVLTRAQMFTACGHQPRTRQTVTLGADEEGRLTALEHRSVNASALDGDHGEETTPGSTWMYASPAIRVRRRVRHLTRAMPTPMRAPHEGPGMFALECAMDELAWATGLDPVELRLRNEPEADPMSGLPFSSRKLRECLRTGAERFGWAERANRAPEPRSWREGDELIGWGMAAATMETFPPGPTLARVGVDRGGRIMVEAATEEIGTGQPAMIATIVGEVLGVRPEEVRRLEWGDSDLPDTPITAGSTSTMGLGSAVHAAAVKLRGMLETGDRPGAGEELVAEASWRPDTTERAGYSTHTYGAVFAEVRVDEQLGTVRVARCTGVYAAGRIVNPLAARSQMTGGMAWGIGQALLEDSRFDERFGRFTSKNLAGYVVPVNADVPPPSALDVSFVDDHDPVASAIGAKGIGELGAVGVAPALVNAVYHATGVRVRRLPVSVPDLVG